MDYLNLLERLTANKELKQSLLLFVDHGVPSTSSFLIKELEKLDFQVIESEEGLAIIPQAKGDLLSNTP